MHVARLGDRCGPTLPLTTAKIPMILWMLCVKKKTKGYEQNKVGLFFEARADGKVLRMTAPNGGHIALGCAAALASDMGLLVVRTSTFVHSPLD